MSTLRGHFRVPSRNVKDALKNDWEQTKSDLPGVEGKDQDVHDTVKQAAGKEPADGSQN